MAHNRGGNPGSSQSGIFLISDLNESHKNGHPTIN